MKTFLSEKGHLFGGEPGSLGTGLKLLAGSTAGIASVRLPRFLSKASADEEEMCDRSHRRTLWTSSARGCPSSLRGPLLQVRHPPHPYSSSLRAHRVKVHAEGSLGMLGMTRKVYAEEGGLRGLYRGCIPTAACVLSLTSSSSSATDHAPALIL